MRPHNFLSSYKKRKYNEIYLLYKKKVEYILSLQNWFINSVHETGTMIAIYPNADESEKDIRYMYHDELWLKK